MWTLTVLIIELITDRGGNGSETCNKEQGMKHWLMVHDTPEKNGVAGCLSQTLVEKALCNTFWFRSTKDLMELWNFACELHQKSPIEEPCWIEHCMNLCVRKKHNLCNSHECGSDAFVKIKHGEKLQPPAKTVKWIGHSSQSNGHCIYFPDLQRVTVEWNIILTGESVDEDTYQKIQQPLQWLKDLFQWFLILI